MSRGFAWFLWSLTLALGCGPQPACAQQSGSADAGWPVYGGDAGGQRFSPLTQINRSNVGSLKVAWTFHTGTFSKASPTSNKRANFEATPVLWRGALYFDTPFDEIFSIDAATGRKIWSYDPAVDREGPIYIVAARGVALWHAAAVRAGSAGPRPAVACSRDRVFVATLDRRLIARDARTGAACEDFGVHGTVDLAAGMNLDQRALGLYGFTSPPTVVGDLVVLGSSIGDNQAVAVASGAVRAFDVRTGRQVWSWDPIPWAGNNRPRTGSGGAWSIMAADVERDMLFVPTGSPSTDYYGGLRPGDNRDADSLVALQASTGKRLWAFQLVHHDLWDYDTPSEPLLFTFRDHIPAVAITAKTGMVFVFNRVTGEPLYPIEERAVPRSTLPGETSWPTQPFSSLPTLTPLTFGARDLDLKDTKDRDYCARQVTKLVNEGLFTPPGLKEALLFPGPLGGANWGSAGIDPATGILYVHTNSVAYVMRQTPKQLSMMDRLGAKIQKHMPAFLSGSSSDGGSKDEPDAVGRIRTPDGGEHSWQSGTPYQLYRAALMAPSGLPCTPQPWGALVAINLNSGKKEWSVAQGTMIAGQHTGAFGMGGPAVTAGGVVFVSATIEPLLRAFDSTSGAELAAFPLPAPANATPMTYAIGGRQYVVVAAGGQGMLGTALSDTVVAFELPARAQVHHRR